MDCPAAAVQASAVQGFDIMTDDELARWRQNPNDPMLLNEM
jgi:hypothetical protein